MLLRGKEKPGPRLALQQKEQSGSTWITGARWFDFRIAARRGAGAACTIPRRRAGGRDGRRVLEMRKAKSQRHGRGRVREGFTCNCDCDKNAASARSGGCLERRKTMYNPGQSTQVREGEPATKLFSAACLASATIASTDSQIAAAAIKPDQFSTIERTA